MRNWKRILAAAGTAVLLVSNVGAISQVTYAEDAPIAEAQPAAGTGEESIEGQDVGTPEREIPAGTEPSGTNTGTPGTSTEGAGSTGASQTGGDQTATGSQTSSDGSAGLGTTGSTAGETPGTSTAGTAVVPGTDGNTQGTGEGTQGETTTGNEGNTGTNTGTNTGDNTGDNLGGDETGTGDGVVDGTVVVDGDEKGSEDGTDAEDAPLVGETKVAIDGENGITVQAYAADGVIPEGAILVASYIKSESTLDSLEQDLNESSKVEEFSGFYALDVHFVDADGEECQPQNDGKVQVTFTLDEGLLPQHVDPESIAVQHFEENDGEVKVVPVADTTNDPDTGKVKAESSSDSVSEEAAASPAVTAAFEVGSFSPFTITWAYSYSERFKITVHYIDKDGNVLTNVDNDGNPTTLADQKDVTIDAYNSSTKENELVFADYKGSMNVTWFGFQEARYGSKDGEVVKSVQAWSYGGSNDQPVFRFFRDTEAVSSFDIYPRNESSVDVYLIYEKYTFPKPVYDKRSLMKDKSVTDNGDGTYQLQMEISGAVGTLESPAKVDIVLILDKSGSMEDGFSGGSGSKLAAVQTAANKLIETISNSKNLDPRFSVISFSGNTATTVNQDWTYRGADAKRAINQITANSGTNYEAGLHQGKEQLSTARSGTQTVVIFLTDGKPTWRGIKGQTQYGAGNEDADYDRNYQYTNRGANLKAAVIKASEISCDAFYAIGVGGDFETQLNAICKGYTDPDGVKRSGVQAGRTDVYSANDTSALDTTFQKIAADIRAILANNVTIQDDLSKYVTLYPEFQVAQNSEITIKVSDIDEIGDDGIPKVLYSGKGSLTLPKTIFNEQTTLTVQVLDSDKDSVYERILLDFPDDYTLEPNYLYTIQATIEPTEDAYDRYRREGYTDDPKDTEGNSTGAAAGIYSNGDAQITYVYKNDREDKKFNRPVVYLSPGTLVIQETYDYGDLTAEEIAEVQELWAARVASSSDTPAYGVSLAWKTAKGTNKDNTNDAYLPTTAALSSLTKVEGTDATYSYTYSDRLSPDTVYTVTTPNETSVTMEDYEVEFVSTNDKNITIRQGQTQTASFQIIFKRSTGALQVTKTVGENQQYVAEDQEFQIKIHVDGVKQNKSYPATIAGQKQNITFDASGNYTATLTDGQSILIDRLPKNQTYTVTETDESSVGYKVSYSGDCSMTGQGTIEARTTKAVTVKNDSKIVETGVDVDDAAFRHLVVMADAMAILFIAYGVTRRRARH